MIGREVPPLSVSARALLDKERGAGFEDDALKLRALDRARAVVELERPSGISLRAAGREAPLLRRKVPRALLLMAATLGVVSLAAAGAGVYRFATATDQAPAPQLPHGTLKAAEPARAAAPVALAAPNPTRNEPPQTAVEPQRAAGPAESARATSIQIYALEAGLLEPARSSIARGDYAGAMAAISKHQREYPRGQLAEEREALRVRALWGVGQKAAAESAAVSFRKRYPRSVLLSWMKEPVKP